MTRYFFLIYILKTLIKISTCEYFIDSDVKHVKVTSETLYKKKYHKHKANNFIGQDARLAIKEIIVDALIIKVTRSNILQM